MLFVSILYFYVLLV